MLDVVVVGAGPAGSLAAFKLAQYGHRVAVFESKDSPGDNVCCTGIVSTTCYDHFIQNLKIQAKPVTAAVLFSPGGEMLRVSKASPQAFIIDRPALNIALYHQGQEAGVEYSLSSTVTGLDTNGETCQIYTGSKRRKTIARAVILACGYGSGLLRQAGFNSIDQRVVGAQMEVSTALDEVEIYFDPVLSPGGFGWLVPTGNGKGLAGLASRRAAARHLEVLLKDLESAKKIGSNRSNVKQKAIPIGMQTSFSRDRVLILGEAAGQVKPTTFGGVYTSLICAEIAALTLHTALALDDLSAGSLRSYQKKCRAAIGHDLHTGYLARRLYDTLNSRQIDRAFTIIRSAGLHEELLNSRDYSFDWHGRLILRMACRPELAACLLTPRTIFEMTVLTALRRAIRRTRA